MSALEYFTKVLQQINESQKGITVQTSIYLKKIDEYLFSGKGPQSLSSKQAQILFLGFPQKKYQGLFQLAGIKGTFGGMKKSSYYALDLIYNCVSKGKHKQVFQKVFTQCDEQDFKLLRLATHISDNKNQSALELCAILKIKRPYLNETDYIFSDQSRKTFEKWFTSNKKKKQKIDHRQEVKSIINSESPQQSLQKDIFKTNPLALIEGMMKAANVQTNLEQLQVYEDYIVDNEDQYLLDTFLDPIDVLEQKRKNDDQRDWLVFKQFMYYLIQTPVTRVSQSVIEQYITSIHMESEDFNPEVLISKFHKKMTDSQKSALSKVVPLHFGIQYKKNLTKYFFQNLVELSKNVTQIKDNFVQNQTIKNDASVSFSLRTQMKQSMKNLCDKVEPLSQKYQQSQKLRKLIMFLEANPQFVKMPMTIRKLLDQRNIKSISVLYKKFQVLIEAYINSPILRDIIQQIENVLIIVRIKQIEVVLIKNYDIEQLDILLGLFNKKNQALIEYLVPKLIFHLIKEINSDSQNQEIKKLQTKIKKYELINFHKTLQNSANTDEVLSELGVDDEGDCLNEFLYKVNKQKNIIEKCNQVKDKVLTKFKMFFQIKKKWAIQYNCYFIELKLLINSMTVWYSKMIKEIIDEKAYDLVYVTSQILILAEKNAQDQVLFGQISKLKQSNFEAYCSLITEKTKKQIQFKKCPIRKDIDGNFFNDILAKMLDSVISNVSSILKFPSFEYKDIFVLRVYKYLLDCFTIEDNKLINLPQLFTYSTVLSCLMQSQVMKPFYKQLQQFTSLKKYLNEALKEKTKQIDSLLYSIIKIEYRSTINRNKKSSFAFAILEYLNECCYLVIQFCSMNYKKHSRFLLEGFQFIANQAMPEIIKENGGKMFIQQLELIKEMTDKIQSKSINAKWNHLLKQVEFNVLQKNQKGQYIAENKHKYSSKFTGLMDY